MSDINTHLPPNVGAFCSMFPASARLCRFVNRESGTLLDVRPDYNVVNDDVPEVVGNPESAGVQYWLITQYGDGQAIIPIPKDGSSKVRYLTPSSIHQEVNVTVSPFPSSWVLMPAGNCSKGSPRTAYSVPQGLYEEWTCLISWPHHEGRMLDLWAGEAKPNQRVVIYPFEHLKRWQYWRVQFIRHKFMESIPPVLPIQTAETNVHGQIPAKVPAYAPC